MSRLVRVCTALIAICFAVMVQAQDFDEVKRKAEKGDVEAQYDLGVMYAEGQGVAQNYAEAMKWVKKAAKKGNAEAQYKLGWMYAAGKGTSRNAKKAVKWYRMAADQGHAAAYKILEIYHPADLYINSRGVEMDALKASLPNILMSLPTIFLIYRYFKCERMLIERGDVRGKVYAQRSEHE